MGKVRIPVICVPVSLGKDLFSVLKGQHLKARGNAPGRMGFEFVRGKIHANEHSKIRTKWYIHNFRTNHLFLSVRNKVVALNLVFSRTVSYFPLLPGALPRPIIYRPYRPKRQLIIDYEAFYSK